MGGGEFVIDARRVGWGVPAGAHVVRDGDLERGLEAQVRARLAEAGAVWPEGARLLLYAEDVGVRPVRVRVAFVRVEGEAARRLAEGRAGS